MNDLFELRSAMISILSYSGSGALNLLGMSESELNSIMCMLLRFGFHLLVCLFIVHCCYYRKTKNRDYYKSFMFFASGMFLLLYLLESIRLQIGLTLGLFAIFGVIRYRTETVPVKEMTYLFMIIVISVINGMSLTISYVQLLLANLALMGIMYLAECKNNACTYTKLILYERIELIVPEQRDNLIKDLKERTGLDISDVQVGHIDFLRDAAFIKVIYRSDHVENNTLNEVTKLKP